MIRFFLINKKQGLIKALFHASPKSGPDKTANLCYIMGGERIKKAGSRQKAEGNDPNQSL
jgi:hypothetical protein